MNIGEAQNKLKQVPLKARFFALGECYSCRGLALVANSGVSTLGFKMCSLVILCNIYHATKDRF